MLGVANYCSPMEAECLHASPEEMFQQSPGSGEGDRWLLWREGEFQAEATIGREKLQAGVRLGCCVKTNGLNVSGVDQVEERRRRCGQRVHHWQIHLGFSGLEKAAFTLSEVGHHWNVCKQRNNMI